MAFVGESRRDNASPWEVVVCLRKREGNVLLPLLEKRLRYAEARMEYYQGLNEYGSITAQQDNVLCKWENEVEILGSIISNIKAL